jgi:hypothetical protein
MKIKLDFVTNSSSACFLLSIHKNSLGELLEYISELNEDPEATNEGVRTYFTATSLEQLQEYTNDRPFDWASKPSGLQFINFSEEKYNRCKELIEEGGAVIEVWVDYGVCETFEHDWEAEIVETSS